MTPRRTLFAAALLPFARPAGAFRVEDADGATEALLAAREEACSAASLHDELRAKLEAALAEADEEATVAAVRDALGRCPHCGCGLTFAAGDDAPRF